MSSVGAVGKRELLAWVTEQSQMPCSRLEDLKSGVVLLAVLFRVFPKLVERRLRVRWTPKFDHEQMLNWDAIEHAIASLRLPSELFDRPGLQACRFRPTYNLLVALFFLQQVSANSDFTADFSHPIEPPLASFLQSRAAVECMINGGAIAPAAGTPSMSSDATPGQPDNLPRSAPSSGLESTPGRPHAARDFDPEEATVGSTGYAAAAAMPNDDASAPSVADTSSSSRASCGAPRSGRGSGATTRGTPPRTNLADLRGARPLFSFATTPKSSAPRSSSARRERTNGKRGVASSTASPPVTAAAPPTVHAWSAPLAAESATPSSCGTGYVAVGGNEAANAALIGMRFEVRRLEALVQSTAAELAACHRLHRAERMQMQRECRDRQTAATTAATTAIAQARSDCRRDLATELGQLEAEVLHAYAAELGGPAREAFELEPTSATLLALVDADAGQPASTTRASLFLQRIVSVQSKQIANLHAMLAEQRADETAVQQHTPPNISGLRLPQAGLDDDEEAHPTEGPLVGGVAVVARAEVTTFQAQAQVEALRLALYRMQRQHQRQQQREQPSAAERQADKKQVPHADPQLLPALDLHRHPSHASTPSVHSIARSGPVSAKDALVGLVQQNAMLRRATDFLRRRHREMLLAPKQWTNMSALAGSDEATAAREAKLLLSDADDDVYQVDDDMTAMLDDLNSADAIEARAAALLTRLREGPSEGLPDDLGAPGHSSQHHTATYRASASALGSFWELISALCVEERRRRLLSRRLQELRRRALREADTEAVALTNERMRAHRAELALKVAVVQERSLASRAQAESQVRISLANARAEELQEALEAAESRCGESMRALQASHDGGWRAMQRKLSALEQEVRRLRTRETMWAQLCERQRVLARALRSDGPNVASPAHASAVAQMEDEVAAWERSVLESATPDARHATSLKPVATPHGAVAGAPGWDVPASGEDEVVRRVDEATAVLSAECTTLRNELQSSRSHQIVAAQHAAQCVAESAATKEQLEHANARCEALHATVQECMERIRSLECTVSESAQAARASALSVETAQLAQQLRSDEQVARLASLNVAAGDALAPLTPGESSPMEIKTIYYVDAGVEEAGAEDDSIGGGDGEEEEDTEDPLPISRGSSIFVDPGSEEDDDDLPADGGDGNEFQRHEDDDDGAKLDPGGVSRQISTLYYTVPDDEDGEDDDEGGLENGSPTTPDDDDGSFRCQDSTIYYVADPDAEELSTAMPLPQAPTGMPAAAPRAMQPGLREVSCRLQIGELAQTVVFAVGDDDTPSSLALEVMDELAIEPSGESLKPLVDQIEAALEAAPAPTNV